MVIVPPEVTDSDDTMQPAPEPVSPTVVSITGFPDESNILANPIVPDADAVPATDADSVHTPAEGAEYLPLNEIPDAS
jgi:hypothetical protein